MNMITLNGVQSTDCKGLLIQSLPPISKPLMRTQVEEIDGRDGDIVTKLGYSAYDKEVTIGLYGDYNVDDVISYFDSEGTVIFSNEPDKYYNYQIIEQIDFERLIRFKTATVTFHVQPFKYSAVDKAFILNNQFIDFDTFSETVNGITVSAQNGVISVSGTATKPVEIYMPINPVSLAAGDYTLTADSDGALGTCSIRLINNSPSKSFANNYLTLAEGEVKLQGSLTATETYNYLYFYITMDSTVDFTTEIYLCNDDINSITVFNRGNTVSKPKITIYGKGIVNLSLNGIQIFTLNLATPITIDAAQMNAYYDGSLMNRYVTGDYDNLVLSIGTNTISWTGFVTGIEVEDFTRWI